MAKKKRARKTQRAPAPHCAPDPTPPRHRLHWLLVPALLAIAALLAVSSLVGDSATFDEPSHLVSGMSCLKTGDYRMAPDHPPLAKIWAAGPLLLMDQRWPDAQTPSWLAGRHYDLAKVWLFELNDGQRLLVVARSMMVVLLLGTCLSVYAAARTLFGPAAGLLALVLATFSPTLLAHGRLVTTDLPLALCSMLTLLAFARLMHKITCVRLLSAAVAIAALSLVKFSWPLVAVGLLGMVLVAVARPRPPELGWPRQRLLTRRLQRVAALAPLGLVLVLTTWVAIWSCYGWRYDMMSEDSHAEPGSTEAEDHASLRARCDRFWEVMLTAEDGDGFLKRARIELTRLARARRILPEAYLYGFSMALHTTARRSSYFMGEYSVQGRVGYFPLAFAIKTPIATMLLLAAGIAAIVRHRPLLRQEPILLAGLTLFALAYGFAALGSHVNIGHRHILPLYPVVCVLAGAPARWWSHRPARWLIGASVAWLVAANLWIHPHYLSYFNELIGGPANGHKYLADSNIDWGQDLKRLAEYAQERPQEPIQLAYFGSADPAAYGVNCAALPSYWQFGRPAELTPGTYVVSLTQLLGVYDPEICRDSFWANPQVRRGYRQLHDLVRRPAAPDESAAARAQRLKLTSEYEMLRRKRLINQLRHRSPDERIGYSLFVYHLSELDLKQLLRPPPSSPRGATGP